MQEIMRNLSKKENQQQQQLYGAIGPPSRLQSTTKTFRQKSFASHFPFRRKRNKSLPRASASLREKFSSSTHVLVGKSIDDIDHEYFVREAGRSLYSFKT